MTFPLKNFTALVVFDGWWNWNNVCTVTYCVPVIDKDVHVSAFTISTPIAVLVVCSFVIYDGVYMCSGRVSNYLTTVIWYTLLVIDCCVLCSDCITDCCEWAFCPSELFFSQDLYFRALTWSLMYYILLFALQSSDAFVLICFTCCCGEFSHFSSI